MRFSQFLNLRFQRLYQHALVGAGRFRRLILLIQVAEVAQQGLVPS